MKVSISLTMDGLRRSLEAIARSMADERDRLYAGTGEHAGRVDAMAERKTARIGRDEFGGD